MVCNYEERKTMNKQVKVIEASSRESFERQLKDFIGWRLESAGMSIDNMGYKNWWAILTS
jgi:hypothetical protein